MPTVDFQCETAVCDLICDGTKYEWCTLPGATASDWEESFKEDGKGDCPESQAWLDEEIDLFAKGCKEKPNDCERRLGAMCKGGWNAGKEYKYAACTIAGCDEICKQEHFSWCPGTRPFSLSTGALVGIIVAVVVVVALVIGGVVFIVLKKNDIA
jgi:hypothetical protein